MPKTGKTTRHSFNETVQQIHKNIEHIQFNQATQYIPTVKSSNIIPERKKQSTRRPRRARDKMELSEAMHDGVRAAEAAAGAKGKWVCSRFNKAPNTSSGRA